MSINCVSSARYHTISGCVALLVLSNAGVPALVLAGTGDCTPGFSDEIVITTDAGRANAVVAADLDGDGDNDVVSASRSDNKIAWYENLDGTGHFGPERVITTSANGATDVVAADLNGDGDLDVLVAAISSGSIEWYENTDGLGTFGARRVIEQSAGLVQTVEAADLDGDDDMDVLVSNTAPGEIMWYENTNANFVLRQVINNTFSGGNAARAVDLDDDGDNDVLAADDESVLWHENIDGLGTFGPPLIITSVGAFRATAFAADLDGDGDDDVLVGRNLSHTVTPFVAGVFWLENLGDAETFGPKQEISNEVSFVWSVVAGDIDGDGDNDAVTGSRDDQVAWYENLNGLGTFGPVQLISTSAVDVLAVHVADLDGDADLDVISASQGDDKVAWYENRWRDCNANGADDRCDVSDGTSEDCNADFVPDECQRDEDCNTNSVRDICDIAAGTELDCNGNLRPDSCDLSDGTSEDCNADGIPDECCTVSPPQLVRPLKSRYMTLTAIGSPGLSYAIRVTPTMLPDFPAFEGLPLWVGPPGDYPDEDISQPNLTFVAAELQCDPYYHDWSTFSMLHVFGAEVIPQALYDVQLIEEGCATDNEFNFCALRAAATGTFGDNSPPYDDPPGSRPEPSFADIAGAVDKFLATPGAPIKAQAQLQPNRVFPNRPIDLRDIANTVNGFLGIPYSSITGFFSGPCLCPSAVTCGATPCFNDTQCGDGLCIDNFCTDACGRCRP